MNVPPEFDHEALLRKRVALMRELGVVKWGNVELGPQPTPRQAVEARDGEDSETAREERRREAMRDLIQEYRDMLGNYGASDEAILALIPPERVEALKA